MKYRVNFIKYTSVYVEADAFEIAHKMAEFHLEQFPEKYEAESWFPHSIQKAHGEQSKDTVYIDG